MEKNKSFKTISAFLAYYMDKKDVAIVGEALISNQYDCCIALNVQEAPCEEIVEVMDKDQIEKVLNQIKNMVNLKYVLVMDEIKEMHYYFK